MANIKGKKYYTLICRDSVTEKWTIQFGDYDRECVADEAAEYRDSQQWKFTKIICTSAAQSVIDAEVARLNARSEAVTVAQSVEELFN